MSGCDFPVMTQADVAALGEIEAVINRARIGAIAALDSAGFYRDRERSRVARMLTHDRGRHVTNRARHVPPALRGNLRLFADAHGPAVLAASALAAYYCHLWGARRSGRSVVAGIRPRRVTAGGLAIVRGRR